MKVNKNNTILKALILAAALLISSLLLKSNGEHEQTTWFLILIAVTYVSLNLNKTNKLSCRAENHNVKK